jgi:hypothetical protein
MAKEYARIYVLWVCLCRIQLKNVKQYVQLASLSLLLVIVWINVLAILKHTAITKFVTIAVSTQLIIYMPTILQVSV